MDKFLVGSRYFFEGRYDDFVSKDSDMLILVDNPVGFRFTRQITGQGKCVFEWKRMPVSEFLKYATESKLPMTAGKFLIPEFCKEIGFTLDDLKTLAFQFENMDDKHKYEKVIFDSYVENGDFMLTDEQRRRAYDEYRKYRS